MSHGNLKKDLDEVNISLFSAVSAWMKKRGKVLKPKLTEEQKKQLMECFELMDADGSGAIDSQELGNAFKLLGLNVSKAEMKELLSEVDRDGSGELEFAEFLEVMTSTLKRIEERKQDGEERQASPVPFALMATAYRRKRMMEGMLNGDKEVKQQMVQMADDLQHQQQQQQAAAEAAKIPSTSTTPSKPSPRPSDAHVDAAPDSGRRSRSFDDPHLAARSASAARLQHLPGEFFSQIKQRVDLRRSVPDSSLLPCTNEELKALDPEDSCAFDPLISRPMSTEPGASSRVTNSGRISPGMLQMMHTSPEKLRVDVKLPIRSARRSTSLPSTGLPDMQLGADLDMMLPRASNGSDAADGTRPRSSSAQRSSSSRPGTPQSPKLTPLMKHEAGLSVQQEFAGVSGRASSPVPRPGSPLRSYSSKQSWSRGAASPGQQQEPAAAAQSTFMTSSRASTADYQAGRSSSTDARQSALLDGAAQPGSGRSSHSNRSSLELPAIPSVSDTNSGAQQYGKLASMLRMSNTQMSGWTSGPNASAGVHSTIAANDGFWSSSQVQPMHSRASYEHLHIMPGAAAAAAAASAFSPSAGRRSKPNSLELERSSLGAAAAPMASSGDAAAGASPERRSLGSMWSFGRQPASNSERRSIGNQLAAAGSTSGSSRGRSSLDMRPPVLTGQAPLSSAAPRNLLYEQVVFNHELYSRPSNNNRDTEGLPKGASPGR